MLAQPASHISESSAAAVLLGDLGTACINDPFLRHTARLFDLPGLLRGREVCLGLLGPFSVPASLYAGRSDPVAVQPRRTGHQARCYRGNPLTHSSLSVARRACSPGSVLPPARTQRSSSSHAPARSPAISLRTSVEPQKAPVPTLIEKDR